MSAGEAPHPLDGVPYPDGLALTGPDRQEWESRKRGTHVAVVLALASGRFVVADTFARARAVVNESGLAAAVRAVRDSVVDDYRPPKAPEARSGASAEDLGL